MNFFRTIKFKLTLWYSGLLILLSLILLISINVVITLGFLKDPVYNSLDQALRTRPQIMRRWEDLDYDKKELVMEYRKNDLGMIRRISVLSFIPLTILSFGGGYVIAGQMLKPLKKLNTAVSEVTVKNLAKEIPYEKNGDEISDLIGSFNKMILRLNSSFELQKQFVGDASHELKTPLAIIQTNLDSALVDKSISKKEMTALIKTSLKSTKFMNNLIEDLLLLAILENHIEKEKMSVSEIVKDSVAQLRILARKKKIRIAYVPCKDSKNLFINGNSVLVQQAIINIIENAVKYSPAGSQIKVSLTSGSRNVIVDVEDCGVGIPTGESKKIFERFYRIDKSRSRQSGGSGLGLAITKKIVEVHKGTVFVRSRQKSTKPGVKSGSKFTMKFPLFKGKNKR
ncbi:MAG: HAMP domain-containing sensor histidine kinase [Patescibacteria group bacterium]|nr:HAMP domain-containing sensor histidine kinase [Patescibacteria group bacterium]